ncbi:peptidoglycan/xylan/chitin deacetylase (PgdA/CDA1 family) [Halopolyspora algeriensis]|uniref:Peptidoglycan/xylan/chitin deacetylase (PgdA/CDA1 family) n=1 Tax=Halopolyspora algeriensis TaxID=1500506 RepID=A0A368VL11_9ACTN|nr:polysaccharide deacetylase family protein [Halopolyspora algeriensis]RCW40355.1 peptidoglycan/xylan/chitin deacetylase (PgdA/CDA1 family) [Halopolyspora algeriensis]TQM53640.1 peptidoglycan/xylan/chitin deacetylase (PgdA/CDA1 family) [Halopolyspora algeriensis]
MSGLTALIAVTGLTLVTGCGAPREVEPAATQDPPQPTTSSATTSPPPPPASVAANELGQVPVLMYHRITPNPSSVYDRTPQEFRAELERLAREDYVPVTTAEYATGNMDIPAGSHPVVLTFDDSSVSQFSLDANGEPAQGTAVRILLDVAADHPDFRPVASFYVTEPVFGKQDNQRTLRWLHEHGFEIGNHTRQHPNLGQVSAREVQRQIATMQQEITSAVPDARVRTMALPLGVAPDNEELARSGSFEGTRYRHEAVLLVGAGPAPSPFSQEFDPLNIPRIRSQGDSGKGARFGSTAWLDKLAANPQRRYTSDGDPERISFPDGSDGSIAEPLATRAHPY